MPTALRVPLISLLVVPGLTLGAIWLTWSLLGEVVSPWPWLAGLAAFMVAALAGARWAGVRDWGLVPFLVVAVVAVPWWAAAILIYLWMLAPAGLLAGVLFWFVVLGLLAAGSQLAG